MILSDTILETSKVVNGIVRFKSFAYKFGEYPLVSIITSFPEFQIKGNNDKYDFSKIKIRDRKVRFDLKKKQKSPFSLSHTPITT